MTHTAQTRKHLSLQQRIGPARHSGPARHIEPARHIKPALKALGILVLLASAACSTQLPQESEIVDVRPDRVQHGDTLIIEGARVMAKPQGVGDSLAVLRPQPTFRMDAETTTVILDGTFSRPGQDPVVKTVRLPARPLAALANPVWADRVIVTITPAVEQKIGGPFRFVGKIAVEQKDKSDRAVTTWTGIKAPLHISFFQPSMKSLADLVGYFLIDGRLLGWMGMELKPTAAGLEVISVHRLDSADHGPTLAAKIGLTPGDLLTHAGNRPLRQVEDLTAVIRDAKRPAVAIAVTSSGREVKRILPLKDAPFLPPLGIIYFLVMIIFAVIILALAMMTSGFLTWVERRVAGSMQSRIGPNRVGPWGILQWIADGIKLVLKEDIIPDAVDRPLFKLAPYLVFMGLLGTFVVIPFGQVLIVADLNVGLLYVLAITGFVALGLMMAGWSSNNKWALFGGMRSAAQIISYEIPTGLALMVPVVLAGTLSTQTLVERQGGFPWEWHAFDNPLIFVCFFIYFVSALAEGNRTPFDLPEAESELVAGYNIEYSGWRFAVFFLSEWANLFVVGAIATTVFLGGWQIPGITLAQHAAHWYWQLLGLCLFYAKSMTLVFVIIWIRWTLPRFRVDQMMSLCWKYFVPWSFAAIIFQALWTWLAPEGIRSLVQVGTFLVLGIGLMTYFFYRVHYNWKENPEKFSWKQLY